jgi:putative inorganic carbon (hco3(-)) transporter
LILIRNGGEFLFIVPPAFIIAFVAFFAIDMFLLLLVFLVPVSVQLRFVIPDTPVDVFLPTEIMLAGILILMTFKIFITHEVDRKILFHPVSIISYCMLGWCLITSLSSTLPIVSIKNFITRLWFFAGFYLLAAQIFGKPEKIRKYFFAYTAGMIPVAIYYLIRMWQAGIFNQKYAYKAIRPFFNDHTSFGAALAFCLPLIIFLMIKKDNTILSRSAFFFGLLIFSAAFLFSYSRAAWLSLIVAALVVMFLLMKISWKIVSTLLITGSIIIFMLWSQLVSQLNENKQDSSNSFRSHIRSITNIRTDASNMERINRWKTALRMFREKPIMGWGPATYQFKYASYQMADEKTIISTNYGEGGNAHSEYLGALVDSGITGLILYLILLFISLRKGIIIWKTHRDRQIRLIALALVAGLVTYAIHGALNNFLDTDKISVLFWGMIAAIVAIDTGLKNDLENDKITGNDRSSQISSNN